VYRSLAKRRKSKGKKKKRKKQNSTINKDFRMDVKKKIMSVSFNRERASREYSTEKEKK